MILDCIIFGVIVLSLAGVLYYATELCRLEKEKDNLRKRRVLIEEARYELSTFKDPSYGLMALYSFIAKWHTRLDFETIENLGPERYGIFRCYHMSDITPDDIYLGGIYGVWTNTLRWWESHSHPTKDEYQIVFEQLYNLLYSNLKAESDRIMKQVEGVTHVFK